MPLGKGKRVPEEGVYEVKSWPGMGTLGSCQNLEGGD